MPEFTTSTAGLTELEADVLAVFATSGRSNGGGNAVLGAAAAEAGQVLGVALEEELGALRFEGKLGTVGRVPTRGALKAPLLLVVGLDTSPNVDLEKLRKGAGLAARNATRGSTLAIVVPADLLPPETDPSELVQAVVEGAGLGSYAYTAYRTKAPDVPTVERVVVATGDLEAGAAETGLAAGRAVVRATSLVRDLVNTPPGAKRPPELAERVAELARSVGIEARIFDETALKEGGFGGILGVGQGSSAPPRLVELTWSPPEASDGHVALVGKGITFDTGGISLKPSASMATMKSDMGGAAAVLGAMSALAELQVPQRVTGLLALAENMPSGQAIRVSDVLTHRGGTTVEVMNTDAEGRLVLADAIAYAAESEPDAIIDLATLTGAQIVALGNHISGLMGTDDDLLQQLERAAEQAGERVWRLPLPEDYAEQLRSEVADFKNIGRRGEAGTLIAGLFLKEFTAGTPWAHLDIAGPAYTEEGDGYYLSKGGTGAMVRTLVRFLRHRSRIA